MATTKRQSTRITRTRATDTDGASTPDGSAPAGATPEAAKPAAKPATRRRRRPSAYRRSWASAAVGVPTGDADGRLDELPRDLVLRAAREKYPWIARFIREKCPPGKLMAYARLYAEANAIPPAKIPPYSTLNTWVHRYLAARGLAGLVDAPSRQAGRSRAVTGDALKHLEVAASTGRGPARILDYLAEALPPGAALPAYHAVFRELKRFEQREPHLVAMAREGPTWFRDHCEIALSHGIFPGGLRLTIDSTVADAWVRVRYGGGYKAFRPVLTVVEDVGSRLGVTFNLSLYAIDAGICAAVLGRALTQAENYPGLLSVGVPHQITLDKGAEHQGAFRELLDVLRIEVVPRKDNDPRGGPHVERLLGTITSEVLANLKGYSKCERVFDPYAPAEDDVKRNLTALKYAPYKREVAVEALPTLAELEARILAFLTVYNERPHKALRLDDAATQAVLAGVQRAVARPHPFAPAERVA